MSAALNQLSAQMQLGNSTVGLYDNSTSLAVNGTSGCPASSQNSTSGACNQGKGAAKKGKKDKAVGKDAAPGKKGGKHAGNPNAGNSTALVSGNSTAVGSGNSTLVYSGNSTLVDSGNSTLVDSGNSTLVDSGNSTLVDSGNSTLVNSTSSVYNATSLNPTSTDNSTSLVDSMANCGSALASNSTSMNNCTLNNGNSTNNNTVVADSMKKAKLHVKDAQKALAAVMAGSKSAHMSQVNGNITLAVNAMNGMTMKSNGTGKGVKSAMSKVMSIAKNLLTDAKAMGSNCPST